MSDEWISLTADDAANHLGELMSRGFTVDITAPARLRAPRSTPALAYLTQHEITHRIDRIESTTAMEIRLRVEAVNRWYVHDWNTLDHKIRSSIVEGVSVFLSMFDLPAVARVFCPPAPEARRFRGTAEPRPADKAGTQLPALPGTALRGDLPPLDQLIEGARCWP